MKKSLVVLSFLFAVSCRESRHVQKEVVDLKDSNELMAEIKHDTIIFTKETLPIEHYNFNKLLIGKHSIGKVKTNTRISKAELLFDFDNIDTVSIGCYGFCGGGEAYQYSMNGEILLSFIPKRYTDTILYIAAVHPNIMTATSLSPHSSLKKLLEYYPDLLLEQDLMTGNEYFYDSVYQWQFVNVLCKGEKMMGNYPIAEVPSKPFSLAQHFDWILIK